VVAETALNPENLAAAITARARARSRRRIWWI
jgi:hypothetical protein